MKPNRLSTRMARLGLLGLSLVFSLAFLEAALRAAGFTPWRDSSVHRNVPRMYDPDPVLGWGKRTGLYAYAGWRTSDTVRVTFWDGNRRATRVAEAKDGVRIVFLGDSFVEGWGLCDEETCAWRLQSLLPNLCIENCGTAAYSTYQSMLMLGALLTNRVRPDLVVYGLIEEDEKRNVAAGDWLEALAGSETAAVPYCTLRPDGSLRSFPPKKYPVWPLRKNLATVAFLEKVYSRLDSLRRSPQRRAVTQRLLVDMDSLCRSNGVRFAVVMLKFINDGSSPIYDKAKPEYVGFFETNGIRYLDCLFQFTNVRRIPVDNHPNGEMNRLWAECLKPHLEQLVVSP